MMTILEELCGQVKLFFERVEPRVVWLGF